MTLFLYYFIGTFILTLGCLFLGYWLGNRDGEHEYTLRCSCGGTDFKEKKYWYCCKDCGQIIKK